MYNVYFIDYKVNETLKSAYSSINQIEGANLKWCSPNEIVKQFKKYDKTSSFIFSVFEGAAFDHLRRLNMTIFGPQLLLYYLPLEESLPKMNIPLLNAALKNVIVCFTDLPESTKSLFGERVSMMHGTVSRSLTTDVSVLVSPSVMSKKFRVAAQRGIPVVLESWVDELWTISNDGKIVHGLEEIIARNRVPVLHKLKICCSGLNIEERTTVERLVREHGGYYYSDLTAGQCSHLITRSTEGRKYSYAQKWGIQTVSMEWLEESIAQGHALDVTQYPPTARISLVTGSTPKTATNTEFNPEFSLISVGGQIEETLLYDLNDSGAILIQSEPSSPIWTDCIIAFSPNIDRIIVNKWREIIEKHGGTVSSDNAQITHFISANNHSIIEQKLGRISNANINWLESCLKDNRLVDIPSKFDDWDTLDQLMQDATVTSDGNHKIDNQSFDDETKIDNQTIDNGEKPNKSGNQSLVSHNTIDNGIFSRCRFFLSESLPADEGKLVTDLVMDNGGSIVPLSCEATHQIDREILSRSSPIKSLNNHSTECVTVFYVQSCVRHASLLPIESDFMFRPVQVDSGSSVLFRGCVLSFSGYPADERKLMKSICAALGAIIQDQMARKPVPSKRILQTTHLIIGKIDRKKYPSSKLWRIPAVTKHWIGASISRGSLITDTVQFELSPESQEDALSHEASFNSSVLTTALMNETLIDCLPPVPGHHPIFKTPTNKHLLIRQSVDQLDSPIFRNSLSSNNCPRKFEIDKEVLQTPEYYRPPFSTITAVSNLNKSITTPDIEKALKSRLDLLNIAANKRRPNKLLDATLSDNDSKHLLKPLSSASIYISKSAQSQQMTLKEIIEKLGGDYCWVYESKIVTHVICGSVMKELTSRNKEELEKAAKDGKILVTSDWLLNCNIEQKRIDEGKYLVNVNESLEDTTIDIVNRKRKASKEFCDITNVIDREIRQNCEVPKEKLNESLNTSEAFCDLISNNENQCERKEILSKEKEITDQSECDLEHQSLKDTFFEQVECPESELVESRVIMFSNIGRETRQKYREAIDILGGSLNLAEEFEMEVTHLICIEPGRNEKYLSAIAAGKWVLHKSYIDESIEAGQWKDEKEFEWGGPRTAEFLEMNPSKAYNAQDRALAYSPKRLREIGGEAFKEWRVCLIEKPDRYEKMAKIIKCGGGTVLPVAPLPRKNEVTHFLINKNQCSGLNYLEDYCCYKIEFIPYFLSARNEAENAKYVKKFCVPQKEISSLTKSEETTERRRRHSKKI